MPLRLTPFQAKYFAHELRRSYANDHVGKLSGLLFDAQVEPKPHQIDAALFALQTPFLNGVILADEVGLGKTIEAGLVITQFWAERKRAIVVITPASLRQQWQQELAEKFNLPSALLDSSNFKTHLAARNIRSAEILICSYEFARVHEAALMRAWDLVVCDEAHRLRSFYKKSKTPAAISRVLANAKKSLLLTATPLQNNLDELYGLVASFDPEYFHSLTAFRERYVRGRGFEDDGDLRERVAMIAKRTLRRDAQKYIHFTERLPITVEFEPAAPEQLLYEKVNAYLQRDELFAFSASQRHLTALILRKRLGSSTYAVASTLENVANRLEAQVYSGRLADSEDDAFDADMTAEEREAFSDTAELSIDDLSAPEQRRMALREVAELREYAALARSISVNQKAVALNKALATGFAKLEQLGAERKAIIFTDSTKTQDYIAASLTEAGYGEGIVLFNGQNNSAHARRIYTQWLAKNDGSDLVTGNYAADVRKALVDYFRDHGQIMIATEAAAEGLNLQFCSMIVNYDLPWNPQRVEQRIGRCHRFGQKHNVVVVNFSNKGNLAEQRILELLSDKFHLFQGVFGASDEVLGRIEDGLDFEKRISDILARCRTAADIQREFDMLDREYAHVISTEMATTREKIFDNLDPHVQDRLKTYDAESGRVLNRFERLLLAVTRYSLDGVAQFSADGRQFVLAVPPTPETKPGTYYFKSRPVANAHQYRFDSPLAAWVLDQAYAADTAPAEVTFSVGATERPTAQARKLIGEAGVLTIDEITFHMQANHEDVTETYLLAAAVTDQGVHLDAETVDEILSLQSVDMRRAGEGPDAAGLADDLAAQQKALDNEVKARNANYFDQQEEIFHRNIEDRRAESEAKIREWQKKADNARRSARVADDPVQALRLKRECTKWERMIDDEADRVRAERRQLYDQQDEFLELIGQALEGSNEREPLFSLRWRVEA
jgi:ERCC4-related helicase